MFTELEDVVAENEYIDFSYEGHGTPCLLREDKIWFEIDQNKITVNYKIAYESVLGGILVYCGILKTSSTFERTINRKLDSFYIDGFSLDVYLKYQDYLKSNLPIYLVSPVFPFRTNEKVQILNKNILKGLIKNVN